MTLEHYRRLMFDLEFRASLRLTFALASAATIISAVAGMALALALREWARRSSILNALLQVPLAVPQLAMAVVLINLIAPSGLIARVAYAFGLIEAPAGFPALIGDRYGLGILIAYVLKETPFIAPGLAVAAVFAFLISWSQYLTTLLIGGGRVMTLPLLLVSFQRGGDEAVTAALSLIFLAPTLIVFVTVARFLKNDT